MILIICIDDNGGMMFNKRRQSQDKILIKKITELALGKKIRINSYSKSLFEQCTNADIGIDDNFLSNAADGEFCFAECGNLEQYRQKIEKLVVFKWNRHYPADVYLDIDLSDFILESSVDFEGSSHEKITMEVYKS